MKSPTVKPQATASAARARADGARIQVRHPRAPSHAELVHELEVHQVELEMQNEELRHAQLDLAAARDRFVDLYDFAPVGYFTLDARGMVAEANLTGAAMLGTGRKALLGRGFSRFVVPAHTDIWHQHLRRTSQQAGLGRVELVLQKHSGDTFHGQLDCVPVMLAGDTTMLRVTLTDITQRKLAEMDRRIADSAQDAREAERRHVARELHEGLGQRLSALKMELGTLALQADPAATRERVAAMLDTLDEALASVRRIDLRPLMLDDLGLGAAIDWLAHDVARRLGYDISLDLQEIEPAADERTSIAVYRMAQDILDHIALRGNAASVAVSLSQQAAELVLTVRCKSTSPPRGREFAADSDITQDLHDRARLMGGRLEIGNASRQDPSITLRMPLPHSDTGVKMPQAGGGWLDMSDPRPKDTK